jgi:hypothetical protein
VLSRRDEFGFDGRRRRLLEVTESRQETGADVSTTVRTVRAPDVNGRLVLKSRSVDERRLVGNELRRLTTLSLPGPETSLHEAARMERIEQRVSGSVRYDSTHLIRDLNGRWMTIEARSGEIRDAGPSERVEEETVRRQDVAGVMVVSERIVTRRSQSNGRESTVIETYAQNAEGFVRSESRLALSSRVRSTTAMSAAGRQRVEEDVHARNSVAPGDPIRLARRTVEEVRSMDPDRSVTERHVFELDVNGRLALLVSETGEAAGR